jgi:hypothetical protein
MHNYLHRLHYLLLKMLKPNLERRVRTIEHSQEFPVGVGLRGNRVESIPNDSRSPITGKNDAN